MSKELVYVDTDSIFIDYSINIVLMSLNQCIFGGGCYLDKLSNVQVVVKLLSVLGYSVDVYTSSNHDLYEVKVLSFISDKVSENMVDYCEKYD